MQVRRFANKVWERLGHPQVALLILGLLVLIQITAFALPQIPVSASQTAAFNRWLAEFRPRLGEQARTFASLGLLTIRTSLGLRLTLGLIGLVVAANLDRLHEPATRGPWTLPRLSRVFLALGGILVIGGWAGQMLWGWREPEVIAWPGADIELSQRPLSVAQPRRQIGLWPRGYGMYVIRRGQRVGVEIRADRNGDALPLLTSVSEEPRNTLRLALTTQAPDAFFAVQDADLIFRLSQLQGALQLQAYRSASGELLAETRLEVGPHESMLSLNDVHIITSQTLLPRYEVVYNPGAIFEGIGIALFASGALLGSTTCPARLKSELDGADVADAAPDGAGRDRF